MWSLARPLRSVCPSLPSSSHSGPTIIAKRTTVSIAPPLVYPKRAASPKERIYPERKRYKVHEYTRLFDANKKHPLVLFKHVDFTVKRLVQLRKDIQAAALRHATKPKPSLAGPSPAPAAAEQIPELPEFRIVNTNYFGVALRQYPAIDKETQQTISEMVDGGLAVLTFPDLNPPQIDAIIRVLERTVPPRKPKTEAEIAAEKKQAEEEYVPGRRPKGATPPSAPDLILLGALIDGKVYKKDRLKEVAKLPTLDTLRAQIVGLLSAPGSQIAAVLNEAGGAKLARTLEGFKKGLEEAQDGGPKDAPPS